MENPQEPPKTKSFSNMLVLLSVLFIAFLYLQRDGWSRLNSDNNAHDDSLAVVVEKTPMINGVLKLPAGFPQNIPLEEEATIVESATTDFNEWNGQQLSVSYQSTSTVAQKYAEYEAYMKDAGYEIAAGNGTSIKTLFGVKDEANLSVAVSAANGGTLVQLSYLVKSR